MDNTQLVTITISAEEFNRFQGDETRYKALKDQFSSVCSENKRLVDKLREEGAKREIMQESIEVLKKENDYILVPNKLIKYNDFYSYYPDYKPSNIVFFADRYMRSDFADRLESLIKMQEEKFDKIPRWIRKLFGGV